MIADLPVIVCNSGSGVDVDGSGNGEEEEEENCSEHGRNLVFLETEARVNHY